MPKFRKAKEGDKIPISDYNMKSDYLEALTNLKVVGGKFRIDSSGAALDLSKGPQTLAWRVRLRQDLEAPDSTQGVRTARAVRMVADEGGALVETSDEIVLTNRDPNVRGIIGHIISVVRVHTDTGMEWQPLNAEIDLTVENPGGNPPGAPPGSFSCNCRDDCKEGRTIPDGTICCNSPLTWRFITPDPSPGPPVPEDERQPTDLTYAGDDVWKGPDFEGPDCDCDPDICNNTYRWELYPSLTPGQSFLQLVLVTDGGCPQTCLVYVAYEKWNCKCPNVMTRFSWNNVQGVNSIPHCNICVTAKPELADDIGVDPIRPITQVCAAGTGADVPTIWRYDAQQEGGICGGRPGGGSGAAVYDGTANAKAPPTVFMGTRVAVDIWVDVNIPAALPLVQNGSGLSWRTPNLGGPDDPGGVQLGHTITLRDNSSVFEAREYDLWGYSELKIVCTCTPECSLAITLDIPSILPIYGGECFNQGQQTVFNQMYTRTVYKKSISDIPYEEVLCEINQPHTLDIFNSYGYGGATNTLQTSLDVLRSCDRFGDCDDCCHDFLDPDLTTDFSRPASVTVTPYGGGPTSCPNPDPDTVPQTPPTPPSSDGACGDCLPPEEDPNVDDQSCCVGGGCYDMTTALCTSFGGQSYGNSSLCEDVCTGSACCQDSVTCDDNTIRADCVDAGGRWIPNAKCATIQCPTGQTGACCRGDGTCEITPETDCDDFGEEWTSGATCESVDCTVACCKRGDDSPCTLDAQCGCEDGISFTECHTNNGTAYYGYTCTTLDAAVPDACGECDTGTGRCITVFP